MSKPPCTAGLALVCMMPRYRYSETADTLALKVHSGSPAAVTDWAPATEVRARQDMATAMPISFMMRRTVVVTTSTGLVIAEAVAMFTLVKKPLHATHAPRSGEM